MPEQNKLQSAHATGNQHEDEDEKSKSCPSIPPSSDDDEEEKSKSNSDSSILVFFPLSYKTIKYMGGSKLSTTTN